MPNKTDSSLQLMRQAIDQARTTMNADLGGPFGALIIDPTGKIIATTSNTVLHDHDATAHAEINAIRQASKVLGTHDLSGCILYTTAFPCPMCLGAILWSNIKKVIYGCRPEDADQIGFRDDFMYDFLKTDLQDPAVLELTEQHRDACLKLFTEYQTKQKKLY
jgi:guanine deaminase